VPSPLSLSLSLSPLSLSVLAVTPSRPVAHAHTVPRCPFFSSPCLMRASESEKKGRFPVTGDHQHTSGRLVGVFSSPPCALSWHGPLFFSLHALQQRQPGGFFPVTGTHKHREKKIPCGNTHTKHTQSPKTPDTTHPPPVWNSTTTTVATPVWNNTAVMHPPHQFRTSSSIPTPPVKLTRVPPVVYPLLNPPLNPHLGLINFCTRSHSPALASWPAFTLSKKIKKNRPVEPSTAAL